MSNEVLPHHRRRHPDVHQPWAEWSEDQTLHVIVPYINPFRRQFPRQLMNDTIRHLRSSPNVQAHIVEVAFADRPFEVATEENGDFCFRTADELWLKENAINAAVARLPHDWQYAAYVDGDFHFTRHDWALESLHLLRHYDFVQLFSSYADTTAETPSSWTGHRPYRVSSSFAWNFLHPQEFKESMEARNASPDSTKYYFKPSAVSSAQFPFGFWPGAPGGAWAWRRPAFDAVGGLLDTCILGSGDYHTAVGLAGIPDAHREMGLGLAAYTKSITDWQDRAADIHGNIGCVDNFAVHGWHGNKNQRGYGDRPAILAAYQFDPYVDIVRDWQGLYRWSGKKPKLRDATRRFFLSRNEDNPTLLDTKRPLV